jgi:glutathione synthase/RimK-type ligase-like ATP-grasp enzyme
VVWIAPVGVLLTQRQGCLGGVGDGQAAQCGHGGSVVGYDLGAGGLAQSRQIGRGSVVLMTDHGSQEGSRGPLEQAIQLLTGVSPLSVDARHFLTGGSGRVRSGRTGFCMEVPSEGFVATPEVLIVYEIPPAKRRQLMVFQRQLPPKGPLSFSADPQAWRNATNKRCSVECFRRDGVPHMETIALCRPEPETAREAFDRLSRNAWARPTVGAGGHDVFHLTTQEQLDIAARHYAASNQDWLLSRDARNFTPDGRRHQFRVVVLHDRVLRVCEHVQANPDAPCNEAQGAVSTVVPVDYLPSKYRRLAIAATQSLGLPFGGVDLAIENGGVIFEVNVHPTLNVPEGLESVAIPFVEAHLGATSH